MAKKTKSDGFTLPMDKEEETSGGRPRYKEGDYKCRIVKVRPVNSKEKHTPGIEFTFLVLDGPDKKAKGKKITETLWLSPKALGRFRTLFSALGMKLPKKAVKIPYAKVLKKELGVTLEDDTYESNGKERVSSTVAFDGFLSLEELEEGEGADEEDDDLEDADDEDDDDEDEDDEDELELEDMDDDDL